MATLLTPLLPHQENVVERLQSLPGLILYHGVGSGKTLSSIAAANALGGKTTVVAPSSLLPNYRKELEKHLDNAKKFKLLSLQAIARTPKLLKPSDILIVDEAHKIRNPWSNAFKAIERVPFQKKILLSGTPLYNAPEDIDNLASLIDPERPAKELVDYYKAEDRSQYPSVKEEVVKVPADKYQKQIHRYYKKPNEQLLYNLLVGLPLEKLDKANDSSYIQDWFRNVTRQVSNEAAGFHIDAKENSPKIKQIVNDIKSGPGKTIVYSNFLSSGLEPVAKQLESQKIPYAFFTGDVSKDDKEKAVKSFNEGTLPVLLLSSSGAEGLDLKGTRQVQIMEPHWNDKKIQQVIGRAVRYKSHDSLPSDQKNVIVKRYIDTTGTRTRTADEILYDLSKKKELQSMLKEKTFMNKRSNDEEYLNEVRKRFKSIPRKPGTGIDYSQLSSILQEEANKELDIEDSYKRQPREYPTLSRSSDSYSYEGYSLPTSEKRLGVNLDTKSISDYIQENARYRQPKSTLYMQQKPTYSEPIQVPYTKPVQVPTSKPIQAQVPTSKPIQAQVTPNKPMQAQVTPNKPMQAQVASNKPMQVQAPKTIYSNDYISGPKATYSNDYISGPKGKQLFDNLEKRPANNKPVSISNMGNFATAKPGTGTIEWKNSKTTTTLGAKNK